MSFLLLNYFAKVAILIDFAVIELNSHFGSIVIVNKLKRYQHGFNALITK